METKILTTSKEDLIIAGNIIKAGGTVIFPTETVYGLGADALNAKAVKKIFEAKGRPSDNPLIVHISDISKLEGLVTKVTENAKKLADAYWPGPMTLILNKKDIISSEVSAGLDTAGIRLPKSEVARQFLAECGVPVAAPSANLSGSPSPTTFKHVYDDMYGRVDAIIEGENCEVGLESTVIDVTGDVPVILRPGGITPEMIKKVCGNVKLAHGIDGVTDEIKPKSPGMKYKHYAPKCDVILLEKEDILSEILKHDKEQTVILCLGENVERYNGYNVINLGNTYDEVATNLFASFRKCDELGYKVALMEKVKEEGIGIAIMNRAKRASKK